MFLQESSLGKNLLGNCSGTAPKMLFRYIESKIKSRKKSYLDISRKLLGNRAKIALKTAPKMLFRRYFEILSKILKMLRDSYRFSRIVQMIRDFQQLIYHKIVGTDWLLELAVGKGLQELPVRRYRLAERSMRHCQRVLRLPSRRRRTLLRRLPPRILLLLQQRMQR